MGPHTFENSGHPVNCNGGCEEHGEVFVQVEPSPTVSISWL